MRYNKMRKIIALLLVAVMCLSFVGCDQTPPNDTIIENEPQYEIVEITLDNWQDYFELCTHHEFEENGFGEFEMITTYYTLVSKSGIVFDINKSEVTVELTANIEDKTYTVDLENKTVVYGETFNTRTYGPEVFTMQQVGQYVGGGLRYGTYFNCCDFLRELQGNAGVVVSIDVSRIAGNFCIQKG